MSLKNTSGIVDSLKNLFQRAPKNVVGIDIGSSSVAVAEVGKLRDGRYKILRFGHALLPEGCVIDDEIHREEELLKGIKSALKAAKIAKGSASIGLSGPGVVTRKLQVAGGSREELEDQVSWEVEQYLPFDIDESYTSFHAIGENEGGGVDVIVAAAKTNVILSFKDVVEKAGLPVKIIDTSIIALTNVFEHVQKATIEKSRENIASWILIDFGAQKSNFVIYRQNAIVFTKEINIAGSMITEEIQRQMGVNFKDAEDLKTTVDESGNLPEEIVIIVNQVLEIFYQEVKKTLEFYITASSDDSLLACYLTGGGSQIVGIQEGLTRVLNIEVMLLDPLERFVIDKKKVDERETSFIRYRGITALGLAMRRLAK